MPHHTICLIAAAGSGTRVGDQLPKQYLPLAGVPMLRHTVLAFLNHQGIDAVRVIYNPEHQDLYDTAVGDLDLLSPVAGGAARQESVRLGLESLREFSPRRVLIHDAARPLVNARVIDRVLEAIATHKAVIPVLPVEDTIKRCADGHIIHTINRTDLMRAQTPQGFSYSDILNAHDRTKGQEFTDDAAINEHLNIPVTTVRGSQINFKITTNEDLKRAEKLMARNTASITHTGMGFDVHAFCPAKSSANNAIMLCGVAVPYDRSLEGHSDSDVGLHAVVDALLGAIGGGDIGEHFPPTDETYKGMDSSVFLAHADTLVKQAGGRIVNIDVTLICQAPKIGPHKEAMRQRIADILGIQASHVNIKATTTEGLGFTGRGEGVAAQAIANVALPA